MALLALVGLMAGLIAVAEAVALVVGSIKMLEVTVDLELSTSKYPTITPRLYLAA